MKWTSRLGWVETSAVMVMLVLLAATTFHFGSLQAFQAFLLGDNLLICVDEDSKRDMRAVDVESQTGGARFLIQMQNLTLGEVVIEGYSADCSCTSMSGLPCSIPPRSIASIRAVVGTREKDSTEVDLFIRLANGALDRVTFSLSGHTDR